LVASFDAKYQDTGKLFLAFMKRIGEKGEKFVNDEKIRLQSLAGSKAITADKARDFKRKIATLSAFE
jgi:hypothetical protein